MGVFVIALTVAREKSMDRYRSSAARGDRRLLSELQKTDAFEIRDESYMSKKKGRKKKPSTQKSHSQSLDSHAMGQLFKDLKAALSDLSKGLFPQSVTQDVLDVHALNLQHVTEFSLRLLHETVYSFEAINTKGYLKRRESFNVDRALRTDMARTIKENETEEEFLQKAYKNFLNQEWKACLNGVLSFLPEVHKHPNVRVYYDVGIAYWHLHQEKSLLPKALEVKELIDYYSNGGNSRDRFDTTSQDFEESNYDRNEILGKKVHGNWKSVVRLNGILTKKTKEETPLTGKGAVYSTHQKCTN